MKKIELGLEKKLNLAKSQLEQSEEEQSLSKSKNSSAHFPNLLEIPSSDLSEETKEPTRRQKTMCNDTRGKGKLDLVDKQQKEFQRSITHNRNAPTEVSAQIEQAKHNMSACLNLLKNISFDIKKYNKGQKAKEPRRKLKERQPDLDTIKTESSLTPRSVKNLALH